jgi:hypothetical protein
MADLAQPAARLPALERQLRRDKLALERLNPIEQAEAYARALERVVDLEAGRRDLREALCVPCATSPREPERDPGPSAPR